MGWIRIGISLALLCLVSTGPVLGQLVDQHFTDADGNEHLLGRLTDQGLSSPPFADWYQTGVDEYRPDDAIMNAIDGIEDYDIQVFMGTWCSDSRREVPRLVKILRGLDFPWKQLSIVGVNRSPDQLKQSPNGEQEGKNIHRVPTIIFYKGGTEVNRIVESPVASLEEDIRTITAGEGYRPHYQIVTQLDELIRTKGAAAVMADAEAISRELKSLSVKVSELNTYGHVQLYRNNADKALSIFEINRRLFPSDANVYESLAVAYYDQRSYRKARDNATQALELDPYNERVLQIMTDIKENAIQVPERTNRAP